MNINHFLTRYPSVLMNETNDQTFETLKLLTAGTTGSRIAKLINFATSCMTPDECYLEVGVFTGFTLISANYQNNRHCVGIDSFQPDQIFSIQPDAVREKLKFNLMNYTFNTLLIDGDFRNVAPDQITKLIGVHFIDGDHCYKAVKDNIAWVTPQLANDAIVILDDVGYPEVIKAIMEIAQEPDYQLVFLYRPQYVGDTVYSVGDKVLHQGLAILRFSRS